MCIYCIRSIILCRVLRSSFAEDEIGTLRSVNAMKFSLGPTFSNCLLTCFLKSFIISRICKARESLYSFSNHKFAIFIVFHLHLPACERFIRYGKNRENEKQPYLFYVASESSIRDVDFGWSL